MVLLKVWNEIGTDKRIELLIEAHVFDEESIPEKQRLSWFALVEETQNKIAKSLSENPGLYSRIVH
jgi:hypothetical protein